MNDLKEKTRYWSEKEDALDCSLRTTRFGRGYRPVARQAAAAAAAAAAVAVVVVVVVTMTAISPH